MLLLLPGLDASPTQDIYSMTYLLLLPGYSLIRSPLKMTVQEATLDGMLVHHRTHSMTYLLLLPRYSLIWSPLKMTVQEVTLDRMLVDHRMPSMK